MRQVVVYNMTTLQSEVCDVLEQTDWNLTVDYGGFQFTLQRGTKDDPYKLIYGKLQLCSSGVMERPLPVFHGGRNNVVDLASFRTYRRIS